MQNSLRRIEEQTLRGMRLKMETHPHLYCMVNRCNCVTKGNDSSYKYIFFILVKLAFPDDFSGKLANTVLKLS